MEPLIHLIYASVSTIDVGEPALAEILRASRYNNGRVGITGMLLHTDGSFFQVLEGHPEEVDAAFARIEQDVRHTRAVTIIRERIARRSFGEWSMGYVTAAAEDVASVAGLNDFFSQASCFAGLTPGRAKRLLTAFRAGRWHAAEPSPSNGPVGHMRQMSA